MRMIPQSQPSVVAPAPVATASTILTRTSRNIVKPMLEIPKSQKKGCKSCGS